MGTDTTNGFLYKPAQGVTGASEKGYFDAGLDRVDARLGKEIWVGDPDYGTTLQNAVTAIATDTVTLHVPLGTHAVTADLNIPATITLRPVRGAMFTVSSGKTLTIAGPIEAGPYQIFSGSGSVSLTCVDQIVYGEWFGTTGVTVNGALISDSLSADSADIASGKFSVDSNGDITKINDVTTSFPSSQGGAGEVLANDGAGTLSWTAVGPVAGAVPIGAILDWTTETPPSGYFECDGSAIDRTTYADLYAVIGTTFGLGNGTTTFNLPDLRGVFVRGWANGSTNDPDRATRTNRGDGTAGDHVGTKQADELKAHLHTGAFAEQDAGQIGGTYHIGSGNQNTSSTGGNETRPINIYLMKIIKY